MKRLLLAVAKAFCADNALQTALGVDKPVPATVLAALNPPMTGYNNYLALTGEQIIKLHDTLSSGAIATMSDTEIQILQNFIEKYADKIAARALDGTNQAQVEMGKDLVARLKEMKKANGDIATRLTALRNSADKKKTGDREVPLNAFLTKHIQNLDVKDKLNDILNELNNKTVLSELLRKNLERLPANKKFCTAMLTCAENTTNKNADLKGMFETPITH